MAKSKSMLAKTKLNHFYGDEPLTVFLKECYEGKKRTNQRYSIRSFAKLLKTDQSFLSRVLKGQAQVSLEKGEEILSILKVEPAVRDQLLKGVSKIRFEKLDDDIFHMVSDWRYFAVLELFTLKGISVTSEVVSEKFNFSPEESERILQRLVSLKFLIQDGTIFKNNIQAATWAPEQETTEAKKLLQKKLLEKSIESLDDTPFSLRDHSSVTLAIKKSEMPVLKQTIKDVRRQMIKMFQKSGDFDEVYQITISLFPLTKISDEI